MALFEKQGFVHGVTPFYYLHFDELTMMDFNHILSLTNIQVAKPFMDSVIELYEFCDKVYKKEDMTDVPEQYHSILFNRAVATRLVDWYNTSLNFGARTLRGIRDEGLVRYDVDHNVKLGRLSLNDLLSFSDQVIDTKLDEELKGYAVTQVDGEYVDLDRKLLELNELSDNLVTAIGLVQKRIERIANQSIKKKAVTLNSAFKHVADEIARIDSQMLGEDSIGNHNEKLYQFSQFIRSTLGKLGMDTTTQKYAKFQDNKSHILSLDKKNYNQKLIPLYETKKQVLEKYLRDVSTTIEILKSDQQVPMFYF